MQRTIFICIWIFVVSLFPAAVPAQIIIPGVGGEAQGADVAVTSLDPDARPDIILMAYYNPPQGNVFRYKVGWNIDDNGNASGWSDVIEVPGAGWEAQGAGAAIINLDADPRPDLVLMANDNPPGPNSFRYRIGWNLNHHGEASNWSDVIIVAGVGHEASGASISFAGLDENPRPEMIVMAYDNPPQDNTFRYRIGWNINEAGRADGWSDPVTVPGVGWEAQGAGIAVAQLDGNGRPDMVLMANDNPPGQNTLRYRFGWNLDGRGVAERWDDARQEPGLGWEAQGAGAAFVELGGNLKLILMAYDNPPGENTFRYKLIPVARAGRAAVATGEADRGTAPEKTGADHAARTQDRAEVENVSRRAGMRPERLLAVERRAEMERVLQPAGIRNDHLQLLDFIDVDKPQDLAAFAGREELLYEAMVDVSKRSGVPPPSRRDINEWVQTSSSAQAKLPDSRALMTDAARETVEMKPARPLSIAYWNRKMASPVLKAEDVLKTVQLLPVILPDKTVNFSLEQGQKTILKDFAAAQAGLYRADISFARKGGHVTLQWRVEKSSGAPVVQGGEALVLEDIIKGQSSYYVYFWLTAQDIAGGQPMKFHIEVSRNEDYKVPPKPKDTIEQMGGDAPEADPTITGSIAVNRQQPTAVGQMGEVDVPFLNKPDPNKINYPIQYVEMSEYKPATRPPGIEYPLKMTLIPDPNTFREPYVEHGITKADDGLVWNEVQIICNDNVITNGQTSNIKGITHYELKNPPPGTYRVLVASPAIKVQQLINSGVVWDTAKNILQVKRVIVRTHLDGGKVPLNYVAELWRLEVSDQAEHGNDDNDSGLGEFKVESNTLLARMPATQAEQKQLDQDPQTWMKKYPMEATRSVFPQEKYIHIPHQGGAYVCYPHRLLSWWGEGDDDSANQLLTVFTTVLEDDDLTWWQQYGEIFTFLVKTVIALFKAAYAGDFSGIAMVFKDAILEGNKLSGLPIQAVDDVTGYTIFSTTRNQGFGLLRPGEKGYDILREFNAEGNGEPELIDTGTWPPPAPGAHIPATVSRRTNSGKRWANTGIAVHKALALYTRRLRVQVRELRVSYDFSIAQAKGDDNTWWWPLKVHSTVGDGILNPVDVELKDNRPQDVKTNWKPAFIHDKPNEWKRAPARYFEIGLWEKSGGEAFAGMVSMTVYPHEFIQLAALGKPMPLDQKARDAFDRGDMEDVKNHSHVIVTKQGPDYIADFTIHDPGYHLEYIKFRVFMEIWYN